MAFQSTSWRRRSSSPSNGNCDSRVDSLDAALILQHGAGLVELLPCQENGDVNEDGLINSIDATLILQFNAGLLLSLPT